MTDVFVRRYEIGDEPAIQEITYRTGFNGQDLTGRGYFDDKRLFFLIFIFYYTKYEPEHCFVAVDSPTDTVVGFIVGTPDTSAQAPRFQRTMPLRIVLRALLVTSWRYPSTLKTLQGMWRMAQEITEQGLDATTLAEYPAHLHVNLFPEYQGMGIGTRLMRCYEQHLISHKAAGVHLQTSNYNQKAIPFYRKMGFTIIKETATAHHPLLEDFTLLTFAKRLDG
jgi:ribosomal protein S18 acetylase RimI-like enzyme